MEQKKTKTVSNSMNDPEFLCCRQQQERLIFGEALQLPKQPPILKWCSIRVAAAAGDLGAGHLADQALHAHFVPLPQL